MSRLELSAIQTKLKAAIQNHQMLVIKMKGDSQNASLKKGLIELQEEIKRLSEEQKRTVVKVRENLVKSSSQTQQLPATPIATLGPTITAIGQPRLVSFPTQGGATILPVGMVAVPIAHMQRPAVGVTIHPANTGPLSQATSISLIPTGIISSACNISLNPINSGATISLGNTVSGLIHGNIAINNLSNNNLISTTASNGSSNSGLNIIDSTVQNSICSAPGSNSGAASVVGGCIPSSNTALANLTNMTNLIIGTNISNGQANSNHVLTNNGMGNGNCSINVASSSAMLSVVSATPVNTMTVSSSAPGIVISQFPQQPLVQPQLLQQQQQQILQMIQQQQQQQQPQQRLASHTPIKVPQYTASVIRPAVSSSTTVQFCNIAPAPSTATTTSSVRLVSSSTSQPLPAKPAISKEATVPKEQQPLAKQDTVKPQIQPPKQQQKQVEIQQQQQKPDQTPVTVVSPEDQEKLIFMRALDLFTIDKLREVMKRRSERKRRTTANPNYSFGFEFSRRDRNGTLWTAISPKKPRKGKGTSASGRGNGWTDSTSLDQQQSRASNKSKSNDNHDDYCAACGRGGQLLMCETCRLVYHLDCLNPRLTEAPKYAWSCPKCLISGKGFAHLNSEALSKVHSYIAKKSAKEDEKKKGQRKGKDMKTEKNLLDNRCKELDAKMKEQTDLQSKLSAEERKVKDELNKLSDFVRAMRESRTTTST